MNLLSHLPNADIIGMHYHAQFVRFDYGVTFMGLWENISSLIIEIPQREIYYYLIHRNITTIGVVEKVP